MRKFSLVILLCFVVFSTFLYASMPKSRSFEFTYEVIVEKIPDNISELRIWLPFLRENSHQIIEEVKIEPEGSFTISYDRTYHNKILNYSLKSPKVSFLKLNVQYKVKRYEYSGGGENLDLNKETQQEDLAKYLKATRLITLSPQVRELASHITRGKNTTMEKARAIYNYVLKNVSYDKTIPGWGNGDTERVCLVKAGNCTDFHSLFISLSRASGIPAKFVMGVPLSKEKEGKIKGYHCWAEFYDDQIGWVPVDISEAWKDKTKKEYYFGTIGENRLEFTYGRDIILEPSQSGEPLNYFFYPYVEIDGKVFDDINVSLKFKELTDERG